MSPRSAQPKCIANCLSSAPTCTASQVAHELLTSRERGDQVTTMPLIDCVTTLDALSLMTQYITRSCTAK